MAFALVASTVVSAQPSKAPCGAFTKLPDGKWRVLKPVKIENENLSTMVGTGSSLDPAPVSRASIFTRHSRRIATKASMQLGLRPRRQNGIGAGP